MKLRILMAIAGIAVASHVLGQSAGNQLLGLGEFEFAFMGDMPYGAANEMKFDNVIAEVNADPSIRFVMHAGDIKAGSELCSNELMQERFDQYQKFDVPFVFTPGDNEWTDCHRENNGSYHPLERLAFLRGLFFPNPDLSTGGRRIRVVSQSKTPGFEEFVENVWFRRNDVVFATLHVVGSNNDLDPWTGIGETAEIFPEHVEEFENRNAANLAWLDVVFQEASDATGLFLLIQANPNFELDAGDPDRAGFNDVIGKLQTFAAAYGKPVVLAHGDNHVLLVDNPLPPVTLSRIQTFGSNQVHWVKVYVDPKSPGVFKFEQRIVKANLP